MEFLEKFGIVEAGKDYAWFDCESFEESENYIDLIENLVSISKSKFLPKNQVVNEGWTENKEHYIIEWNFSFRNENYQIKFLCEKWFDFDLIIELNKIIKDHRIEEQYYPVKTNDQSLIIVFGNDFVKGELLNENFLENSEKLIIKKSENFNSLKIRY